MTAIADIVTAIYVLKMNVPSVSAVHLEEKDYKRLILFLTKLNNFEPESSKAVFLKQCKLYGVEILRKEKK